MEILTNENDFIGVRTTKIYCYPWCSAKKPKLEHVVHFQTGEAAERSGYRACRVCFSALPAGSWEDKKEYIRLRPPKHFRFSEALKYLMRSPDECLYSVENNKVYKMVLLHNESVALKVEADQDHFIRVSFENNKIPKKSIRAEAARYVWEWFDLDRNLDPFYKLAEDDALLSELIKKYDGLRIVGIHDLFETLSWAIIGQQINLAFAYQLKKRFVEKFGKSYTIKGRIYRVFPRPEDIAPLSTDDMTALKFTKRKAEYIIGVAKKIVSNEITRQQWLSFDDREEALRKLISVRGVGNWSANYVMMRCLKDPTAFPIEDIGLQNAVKKQLNLTRKPTLDELKELGLRWSGWEAYATFYLWRDLIQ